MRDNSESESLIRALKYNMFSFVKEGIRLHCMWALKEITSVF
jgi:hypothetical protein